MSFLVKMAEKKLKEIFGSFDLGIQEGIVDTFMRFIRFSKSVKYVVPWTVLRDGNRSALFENFSGAAPKVFTYFIIVVSSNGNNNNWIIIIIIIITKIMMIIIKVFFENIWVPHPWKLSGGTVIPRRDVWLCWHVSKNNILTFYFLFWT